MKQSKTLSSGFSVEETIESLRQELEDERARDIHSCGPSCTRNGCVNSRLRQQLAEKDAEIERLKSSPPDKREDLRCVISDLCEQVRERDNIIAAHQLREQELRKLLSNLADFVQTTVHKEGQWTWTMKESNLLSRSRLLLYLPQDVTALEAYVELASKKTRKACANIATEETAYVPFQGKEYYRFASSVAKKILELPTFTLKDIQK